MIHVFDLFFSELTAPFTLKLEHAVMEKDVQDYTISLLSVRYAINTNPFVFRLIIAK